MVLTNSNIFSPLALFQLKPLAAAAMICVLASCGGTGQDDGGGGAASIQTTLSGVVIDGQLARSTVFIDSNNNGVRDPWERYAFTDDDGYYSYNPLTDTDYCASTASAAEQQYCLVVGDSYSNFVIRIDGGYDNTTNEPFFGQMSRRVNLDDQLDTDQTIISPLTSLFTDLDEQGSNEMLGVLGVTESDLNVNYLNEDGNGQVNARLFNTALKVHKVVSVLADRLADTYTDLGEEFGTPNDATSNVYPSLAEALLNRSADLDIALEDTTVLVNALDTAEEELREIYETRGLNLPADLGSIEAPGGFSRVVNIAIEIPDVIDVLIDKESLDLVFDDIVGGARSIEVLVIKALEEVGTNSSIENFIEFITLPENETLVEGLESSLSQDQADLSGIAQNNFSSDEVDSVEEIEAAATLPSDAEPFFSMSGKRLRVSELDLGQAPNDLKDSEVELYFNGNDNDLSGSFSACIKYIDGASSDGGLGEANTRGELADGYWSLLGATAESGSYSLLLTVSFLGATYQAIMKPAGYEYVNNLEYQLIRFDNDGEIGEWHSEDGIEDNDITPATNAECQQRLPSRVGI